MQSIEQRINDFPEGNATLINILDLVAKVHPFIDVAVTVFKTIYRLEVNRKENDKKTIALHLQISDMMDVLAQLKNVKDVNDVAPDKTTIKGRLETLVDQAAKEMKACSNAFDTYSKKKLVVKVLKITSHQKDLVQFSETFIKLRSEFQFALMIHTAKSVDAANEKLGDVGEKMGMLLEWFKRLVSSEEIEMEKHIQRKGGAKACQENDMILQELIEFESGSSASMGRQGLRRAEAKILSDLDDIKEDLRLEPAAAREKNMEVFSRKFELQKEQIVHEMDLIVTRETDRAISAVTAGPHDKILDWDVYNLWKDMGWQQSVEARHFVMCLRDHFHEKWNVGNRDKRLPNAATPDIPTDTPTTGQNKDQRALAFLSIVRLQPVIEAFDDDAPGLVTVAKVNAFTRSRPRGWSLPHWIAYWAVGSHQTLYDYAEKTRNLISKMFAILPNIHEENIYSINEYLQSVYAGIVTLQIAVTPCSISEGLQAKFKSYVEDEESRLKRALEQVEYHKRIERFALPLLYLLLKRHFEIFRLCQKNKDKNKIVRPHPDELDDAADTIRFVFNAVSERVSRLQSMFKQQKLNVKQEFHVFAHGLYSFYNESNGEWTPESIRDIDFYDEPYDDALVEQNIDSSKILKFPEGQEERDIAAYEVPVPRAPVVSLDTSPLSVILGPWHGFAYEKGETFPSGGMISMDFWLDKVTDEGLHFQASGRDNDREFKVVGKCTPGDTENLINVSLKRTFPDPYYDPSCWRGQLDKSTDTITGTCSSEGEYDDQVDIFILKRTAPEYLRFRPSPEDFQEDKIDSLWTYACTAIRDEVLRKSMSWKCLKGRRDNRKRFIELYVRDNTCGRRLDGDEQIELDELRASFTAVDSRFYHSLARYQVRRTSKYPYCCDHCNGVIGGARLICLVCQPKQTWYTIDLCEDPECVAASVGKEVRSDLPRPHLPTHDFVKVRQVVHDRQFGKLYRDAKAALKKSRAIFERCSSSRPARTGVKAAKGADLVKKGMSAVEKKAPQCIVCKSSVAQPCWYCVNCEEDTFVCKNCDAERRGVSVDNHRMDHALVRCQLLVNEEPEMSVEDRLARLEKTTMSTAKLVESMLQKMSFEKVENA